MIYMLIAIGILIAAIAVYLRIICPGVVRYHFSAHRICKKLSDKNKKEKP